MNTKKINKKNTQIMKAFDKIREFSILEYPDIDPNNYISLEHFLRLFNQKYHSPAVLQTLEMPEVTINSHGYGYVVFPSSSSFNNDSNIIYKLSKQLSKIENKVKGWIIDLRGNGGGNIFIFSLFALIFIPSDFEGQLLSIIRHEDDIILDINVYDDILHMRHKYDQFITSTGIKDNLKRLKNIKNIKILVDKNTGSASEYVAIILKSFGAKIYGEHDTTMGLLNITVGYIIDEYITLFFPNSSVYNKDNFKNEVYINTDKKIKPEFLLP